MYESLKLLLDYGLNPNKVYCDEEPYNDGGNILIALQFVENGYLGADCMALLLEHGGNPCISVNHYHLASEIYGDIGLWFFNAEGPWERYRFDLDMHYFMVLAGFGGRFSNGEGLIDMCEGHDVSELKEHRNFYYGGIESDRSNDHYEICFFDKETNFEVGRY